MVKKTIIITGLLFVAYSGVLYAIRTRPWFLSSQSQWQWNVSRAQEYLYEKNDARVVVVGSSLSATLVDLVPSHWFVMAFKGQSLFDGIEILQRSAAKPSLVLVEINVVTRPMNKRFVDNLFSPGFYTLREWFPVLRAKNAPGSLYLGSIRVATTLWQKHAGGHGGVAVREGAAVSTRGEDAVVRQVVGRMIDDGQESPDSQYIESCVATMKARIDMLQESGVRVILYEMPVDERVFDSPKARLLRSVIRARLPPEVYRYLPTPDCKAFRTTDGSHLDGESSVRYALMMQTNVVRMLPDLLN